MEALQVSVNEKEFFGLEIYVRLKLIPKEAKAKYLSLK